MTKLSFFRTLATLVVVALMATAAPAVGSTIFTDNFDANLPPVSTGLAGDAGLNITPAGWIVANGGSVDIVGTGSFDFLCAGSPSPSRCIDLDGSTGVAGDLQHPISIPGAGTYLLSFWLQPNDRGAGTDLMTASFGTYSQLFSLTSAGSGADSWARYQAIVEFPGATSATLSFDHQGGDNQGILLDNVQVELVPEPATLLLLGGGLTGLALRRQRRNG